MTKRIEDREGVVLTKGVAKILSRMIWPGCATFRSRGEIYGYINNRKPKNIKWENWITYSWIDRCNIILQKEKTELLKKQQELFDKLKAEFNSAV